MNTKSNQTKRSSSSGRLTNDMIHRAQERHTYYRVTTNAPCSITGATKKWSAEENLARKNGTEVDYTYFLRSYRTAGTKTELKEFLESQQIPTEQIEKILTEQCYNPSTYNGILATEFTTELTSATEYKNQQKESKKEKEKEGLTFDLLRKMAEHKESKKEKTTKNRNRTQPIPLPVKYRQVLNDPETLCLDVSKCTEKGSCVPSPDVRPANGIRSKKIVMESVPVISCSRQGLSNFLNIIYEPESIPVLLAEFDALSKKKEALMKKSESDKKKKKKETASHEQVVAPKPVRGAVRVKDASKKHDLVLKEKPTQQILMKSSAVTNAPLVLREETKTAEILSVPVSEKKDVTESKVVPVVSKPLVTKPTDEKKQVLPPMRTSLPQVRTPSVPVEPVGLKKSHPFGIPLPSRGTGISRPMLQTRK